MLAVDPAPYREAFALVCTMAVSESHYRAPLSRRARLVSYGVGLGVWLGVPAVLGFGFAIGFGDPALLLFPVPFAVLLWIFWQLRVTGYRLDNDALTVVRPLRPRRIPLRDLASALHPASLPSGATLGVARIDGFFGRQGRYWNRNWGHFEMYVTDETRLVELLRTDGRRMILSPDRPEAFVEDLRARIGKAPGGS